MSAGDELVDLRARLEADGKVQPDDGSVQGGRLPRMGRPSIDLPPDRAAELRAAKREADRARERYEEKLDELYAEIRRSARVGSRRAIAEETGLSHQRVHQIIEEG